MKLAGKTVVVTGAGSGIGRATALAFAHEGARIAACDVDQARLDALASELGAHALVVRKVDVADREPKQLVAYRAPDVARQSFVRAQRVQQARHSADAPPFGSVEFHLHWSLLDRLMSIAAVAPQILRPFQTISQ